MGQWIDGQGANSKCGWKRKCKLDGAQYNKFVAADLCWFAAVWAPDADKEAFRLACHWVGWVGTSFLFRTWLCH